MNDKHTITESVMEQIEKKSITPKPRWEFLLKNYSMWVIGGAALFVGAVATSSALFVVRNTDWTVRRDLDDSVFGHVVEITPLLWIVVLGAFVSLAMYQMKHTDRGYKYSLYIVIGNIVGSILLGVVMYIWGYGYVVDTYAGRYIPMYQAFEEKREMLWNQPEKGLVAGVVLGTTTDGVYQIRDYSGKVWNIDTTDISIIDMVILDMAREVSLVGVRVGTSTFDVCMVRPWDIRGVHDAFREDVRMHVMMGGLREKEIREGNLDVSPEERDVRLDIRLEQGMGSGRISGKQDMMIRMKDLGYVEKNILEIRGIDCREAMLAE